MESPLTSRLSRPLPVAGSSMPVSPPPVTRRECLEQILRAFLDIADYDDIHQAALRLDFVQQWIADEAARSAGDPVFADLILCGLPQRETRSEFPSGSAA